MLALVASKRLGAIGGDAESGPPVPALSECLDGYFTAGPLRPPGLPAGARRVLDQLPAVDVTVRGVPLTEALRPAYPNA